MERPEASSTRLPRPVVCVFVRELREVSPSHTCHFHTLLRISPWDIRLFPEHFCLSGDGKHRSILRPLPLPVRNALYPTSVGASPIPTYGVRTDYRNRTAVDSTCHSSRAPQRCLHLSTAMKSPKPRRTGTTPPYRKLIPRRLTTASLALPPVF